MLRGRRSLSVAVMAAVVAGCSGGAGCSTSIYNPWTFNKPPTKAQRDLALNQVADRTVVVVAQFGNPTKPPVAWPDIGRTMSDAVARTLFDRGLFEVRINPDLATAIETTLGPSSKTAVDRLARLSRAHPDVHYVVTGKVTDFHHTGDLPRQVRRWGLLGRRREAVVAIDLKIFDLRSQRLVVAEHLTGTSRARLQSARKLYADITIDTYLFWNTPLGKASKKAVGNVVDQVIKVVPPRVGEPKIVDWGVGRRVHVSGGRMWGVAKGQEYYVCRRTGPAGGLRSLPDIDTGQPLRVKITSVSRMTSTGWVLGKPAPDAKLPGAYLRHRPPPAAGPSPPVVGTPASVAANRP
ncbi:MAG: CsgG/HfaB family protein [Planctomycetota bacterium]